MSERGSGTLLWADALVVGESYARPDAHRNFEGEWLQGLGDFETPPGDTGGPATVSLGASVEGAAEVDASLSARLSVTGTLDGAGSVEATVTRLKVLAAELDGTGSVTATAALLRTLDAQLDGAASVEALLEIAPNYVELDAVLDGAGSIEAQLLVRTLVSMEADLVGAGSVTATMVVTRDRGQLSRTLRPGRATRSARWV